MFQLASPEGVCTKEHLLTRSEARDGAHLRAGRQQRTALSTEQDTYSHYEIRTSWSVLALPGAHPALQRAAGPGTKNDLAPSSERVGRAIDTYFRSRIIIHHRTIDSGGPSGDP